MVLPKSADYPRLRRGLPASVLEFPDLFVADYRRTAGSPFAGHSV